MRYDSMYLHLKTYNCFRFEGIEDIATIYFYTFKIHYIKLWERNQNSHLAAWPMMLNVNNVTWALGKNSFVQNSLCGKIQLVLLFIRPCLQGCLHLSSCLPKTAKSSRIAWNLIKKPSRIPTFDVFPPGGQMVRLFGELIPGMVQPNIFSKCCSASLSLHLS